MKIRILALGLFGAAACILSCSGEMHADVGQFFNSKSWPLFSGAALMVLVAGLDKVARIRERAGRQYLPWAGAVLAVVLSVGIGLFAGASVWSAIVQGFVSAAAATGLWEMIGRSLYPYD